MSTFKKAPTTKPARQTLFRHLFWLIACLFTTALLLSGCGDDDEATSTTENDYDNQFGGSYNNDSTESGAPSANSSAYASQAETALANQQVARAQQLYDDWLFNHPTSGQAAAGLAITDLLLILDAWSITELITQHLGAKSAVNSTDLLYGPDGILYWLSRGVSWQDQGQFQGILSLIEHKLPWTKNQLQSITAFVETLNNPINLLIPDLISVADLLHSIEENLQIALNDPYFTKIYIPGEVLHDTRLTLTLGHSELALIQSALAATRAAIHFVAAYQHDWTLENAFGAWRRNPGQLDDEPLFIPAFGADDYAYRYLDQNLLREIARPEQLTEARTALSQSLKHAQNAIQYGIETEKDYILQWSDLNPVYLDNILTLLNAVEAALFTPTKLPFTLPETTADFSPLFTGQKHLDPSIPWMLRVNPSNEEIPDDSTAEASWIYNYNAQKAFLIDDIYSSVPRNDRLFPALKINEPYQYLLKPLLKDYIENVESAYLLAR